MIVSLAKKLVIAVVAAACALAHSQQVSETTNIDMRWNRSWKAGPFSEVATSWGILQTVVPLFELKGPAGTSIGFSIYHRSNQATSGTYTATEGTAGRGWITSATNTISAQSDAVHQFIGPNSTNSWYIINPTQFPPTYTRTAGTRAELYPIVANNRIAGFRVVDQATKTVYIYQQQLAAQIQYRLTTITDSHGNQITYTYDSANRPTRVTDASGVRYYEIGYNSAAINKQVSYVRLVVPGSTRQWDFAYTNDYLDRVTFPAATTGGTRPYVGFHYTTTCNIDDIYDLKGNRWHYAYGYWIAPYVGVQTFYEPSLTNPTTQYNTTGTSFSFSVNNSGPSSGWTRTTTITDKMGRAWKHVYSNSGGTQWFSSPIVRIEDPAVSANSNTVYSESYTWNYADATVATHTDRRGNTMSFSWDTGNKGLLLQKTDRAGNIWRYGYLNDKLVTETSPLGNKVGYYYDWTTYDLTGKVLDPRTDQADATYSKPTGLQLTSSYSYTDQGELESTWTGSDTPTTYSNFDAYGKARTVTDPSGNATTFTFDHFNNKLSTTEPSPGGTTTFTYDNWNRLTRTTMPDTNYVESGYDFNGNVTTVRDANGHTTTTVYDALNRPSTVTQPVDSLAANNLVTSFGYDANGNRTTVTNPRNKVTTSAYNERNQLIQVTYPDNTTRKYHYDGNGNRDKDTDGQNRNTTYTYDNENRLRVTTYPNNTTVTNTWRTDGLRSQMVDPVGTTTWTYNAALQLTQMGAPLTGKTVTYTYDSGGRKRTMAVGNQTWTYNYDSGYRLGNIQQTVGAVTPVSYSYNANSSVYMQTNGNGTRAVYDYDTRGRLNWLSHQTSGGTEQQRFAYTYDANGNLLTYRDTVVGGNDWTTTHTFDWADRLLTETRTGGSTANFTTSYVYDKNGNRTSVTRNGTSSAYTVDNNDKMLTGEGFTFNTYDSDGNPTSIAVPSSGTWTLAYDYENRVKTVTKTSGNCSYRYDGDGRRLEKVEGTTTRRYVYDGWTIIAETDGSNNVLSYFVPGVGYVEGGAQYYYRENAIGSNVAVTNQAGVVQSLSEYDAYGNEYPITTGAKNQFRFAGKHGYQFDESTGLMLLGHRYYAAKLGRFLTQDPIGQEGGLNLYAYCSNNPLVNVDPDGQDWDSFFQGMSDTAAGWGDSLTFGLTKIARKYVGEAVGVGDANEAVNYDSTAYRVGTGIGTAHSIALDGAIGWATGGVKATGMEFSHYVPARFLKGFSKKVKAFGKTKWNGNFVTPRRHALHDPFRYLKGMSKADKLHPVLQILDRTPNVYKGIIVGGALQSTYHITK